jgi:hypothetical protein
MNSKEYVLELFMNELRGLFSEITKQTNKTWGGGFKSLGLGLLKIIVA